MTAPTVEELLERREALRTHYVSAAFAESYYGLGADSPAFRMADRWGGGLRNPRAVVEDARIERHVFELFLQARRFLPRKWAAAELGMDLGSFESLLGALEEQGPFLSAGITVSDLVSQEFVDGIHTLFPATANRIFSSHTSKCARVHEAAREMGAQIEPLWCTTSLRVDPEDTDYAVGFDCLTLEPIGIRRKVSLDFGKPMSLRPDACAELTFSAFQSQLEDYVLAGRTPELDPAVETAAGLWLAEPE